MKALSGLALTLALITGFPAANAASPGIVVAPLKSSGEHPAFPRLKAFPNAAIQSRVNALLAQAEAQNRSDQHDCLQQVMDERHDKSFYSYETDIRVVYISGRFLSLAVRTNYDCAGAHPDSLYAPLTFDLRTGTPIDWAKIFQPGFLDSDGASASQSSRLRKLYTARYLKISADPDCRHMVDDGWSDELILALDTKNGLTIEPSFPHVAQACAEQVNLKPTDIVPFVRDKDFLDDLKQVALKDPK